MSIELDDGFKHESQLFSVILNNYSVNKFVHDDGRVAVALVDCSRYRIDRSDLVYYFDNEQACQEWLADIYDGKKGDIRLNAGDARLLNINLL
jgi:hypothetical protein